jgi:hypothetical protein
LISAKDSASKTLQGVQNSLTGIGKAAAAPVRALGSLGGALGDVVKLGAGFAVGGVLAQAPGMLLDMAKGAAADEQATARLGQTIKNLGGDFDGISAKVNEAISAGQKLAFTDDDVRDSFQFLAAATGDADEALRRQKAAMDLSRGANIPLSQATKMLGKLNEENVEVFKKLGITLGDTASEADALAAVQAKFGGQASAYAESTAGQFEQAQIAVAEISESIGAALLPALAAVGRVLADNLPAIQSFIGGLSSAVSELVSSTIGPLLEMLPTISTALGQVFAFMRDGSGDIEVFRGVLNQLIGPQGAQAVIEVFTNLVGFFRSNVIPLWEGLAAAAQQALSGDFQGALTTAAAALATYGTALVNSLSEWAKRFLEWVAPMIPPLLAELGKLLLALGNWLVTVAAPAIATQLLIWAKAFVEWVGPMIPPFMAEIARLLVELGNWMATVALPAIVAKLAEWGAAFIDWVKTEVIPRIPGALEAIKTALAAFISATATWLLGKAQELGTSFVDGIKQGMANLGPSLWAAAKNLATGAVTAGQDALRAHSPSQETADKIGKPFVEGIIAGINLLGPGITTAARDHLGAAVLTLSGLLDQAKAALVGLGDQLHAAEDDLKGAEKAVKPLQKAFDAASENVKKLKNLLSDLQSELSGLGSGSVDLPGEAELKQTIFGLENAINILEQRKRELLRAGASKDDPAVKALDEEIKRNREELEYQQGKLKAEYDGQRNALDQAAKAGDRVTQTFEEQYARILAIKEAQTVINTVHLPDMVALEEKSKLELEAALLAVEKQKEVVDALKEDYDKLKELAEKWKDQLDAVLDKAKDIKRNLNEALDIKKKLGAPTEGGGGEGGEAAAARTARAGGPVVGTQSNTITIDARGMDADRLATVLPTTLATLARTRVVAGAL